MPKIQEYDAQVNPSLIVQSKPQQGSGIATGLQNIGKGLSDLGSGIDQYQQKQDRLSASAELSEAEREYLDEVNNLKTVPSEEQLNAIRERYDNRVNAISEKMQTSGGSDFLSSKSLAIKESITAHSNAKIAELTAVKNRNEIETLVKNKSIIVANNPTGENLITALADVRSQAFDLMGDKGTALADDLSKSIVMAHFKGILSSSSGGGKVAEHLIKNEKLYDGTGITGAEKEHLIDMAQEYDKSKKAEDITLMRQREYVKSQISQNAENEAYNRAAQGDIADITNHVNNDTRIEDWQRKKAILSAIAEQNSSKIKMVSSLTEADLASKIASGDITDLAPINQKVIDKQLSLPALARVTKQLQAQLSLKGTPEGNVLDQMDKSARSLYLIDPVTKMSKGPLGAQQYAEYKNNVSSAILEFKKNNPGKSLHPLVDPKDPNYLGKFLIPPSQAQARQYMREIQNRGKANGAVAPSAPLKYAPRGANESPDDYLKRIGLKK